MLHFYIPELHTSLNFERFVSDVPFLLDNDKVVVEVRVHLSVLPGRGGRRPHIAVEWSYHYPGGSSRALLARRPF